MKKLTREKLFLTQSSLSSYFTLPLADSVQLLTSDVTFNIIAKKYIQNLRFQHHFFSTQEIWVQRFTNPISLTKASRCETDWRSRWWRRRVTYHTSSYQTRRADPQETASNVSQTAEICHTHMHISQMSTVTHFTWLCHRQLRGVPGYLLTNSDIRQNGKIYLPIGSFSRKSLYLCDPLCDIYINPRRQYEQF